MYNNDELAPSSLSVRVCPKKAIKCVTNLTLSDNTDPNLATSKLAMANANIAPVTFTPHLAGVNPSSPLEVNENKVDNWKLWKQQWIHYFLLSRLDTMDERYQLAMLETCLGITALKVYNNLTFADGEVKSVQICMNKLEQQIVGQINETYERYMFNSRDQNNESIDVYINDSRNLARNCNFCECMHDSLLRDRLVMGIRDKSTRNKLLQITNLTLQQTVDICRVAEATDARLEYLKCEDIHTIRSARNVTKSYRDNRVNSSDEIECLFCGRRYARLKSKCPAWGKTCSKC